MTRLRFRVLEMVAAPVGMVVIQGLMHAAEGSPVVTDWVVGSAVAVALLRGLDVLRAAMGQWPENGG